MKALSAALALTVGAGVVCTAVPAAAATHERPVRAVVTVAPGVPLPLTVPGAKVRNVFSRIGVEVVTAAPTTLLALSHDPRVLGVTADLHGRVSGDDGAAEGAARGVLAADQLGGNAGKPGTGAGVNVALLDTGVSDTRALSRASGRITDGVDVSQLAGGGPALTSGHFTDGYGHGTFLASLIAGGRVPGSGGRAVGVAPAARIVVVKVADAHGNTSLSEVLAGLDWVAAHAQAINVVNLALAVDRPTGTSYGADPLTAAVEHVRAAGVVVVAAAGNKAGQVGDPGLDPQALTVGAADVSSDTPKVAPFSGSGMVDGVAKPDVVAPGVHVLGVINDDSEIAATHPEGRAGHWLFKGSGTSEATAVTTGVVAAYLSDHPGASVLQVKSAVRGQARALADSRAGTGLVQLVNGNGASASLSAAGEATWDQDAWNANAWTGVPNWQTQLQSMWSGPAWDAISWSAITWSAISWSDSRWSAISWSAISWSAISWSAISWSAISWSAISWSDYGWGDS